MFADPSIARSRHCIVEEIDFHLFAVRNPDHGFRLCLSCWISFLVWLRVQNPDPCALDRPNFKGESMGTNLARWCIWALGKRYALFLAATPLSGFRYGIYWSEHCAILPLPNIVARTCWRFTILMVILGRVYPVGYPFLYGFEYETRILAPLKKPYFEGESMGISLARWICWSEHCAVLPLYR